MILSKDELIELRLYQDFCDCGTPDPINCGHATSCPMNLPLDILIEVELLAPSDNVWSREELK